MELLVKGKIDELSNRLINYFKELDEELNLEDSKLYYNYPLFRDDEHFLVEFEILFFSKTLGIFLIFSSNKTRK